MSTPLTGREAETLIGFLAEQRRAVTDALRGLDETQARWRPCEGANSLIELVNHLTWVERWWFDCVFGGEPDPWPEDDPDIDFVVPDDQTVASTIAAYEQRGRASDEVVADASLDTEVAYGDGPVSLRWIMGHMIEETARHAGHADITRQLIDGRKAT